MDVNPFPNKAWFLRVCSTSLLKILWEKEKLFSADLENFLSFSSSLNLLSATSFNLEESTICRLQTLSIWKSLQFVVCKLFQFGRVYNLSSANSFNLEESTICRLQTLSIWKSLQFVVWERVNWSR